MCRLSVRPSVVVVITSGVNCFIFSSSFPEALDGFFHATWYEVLIPRASIVAFRPVPSRGGSMAGQNVSQNGSSFDKLLLQTGCIDRQTEYTRAIVKDVGRSVVVLAPL